MGVQQTGGVANPGPGGPPVVSQAILEEYAFLAGQARRLRELRVEILRRLAAGAPVEPGEWTATVAEVTSRRLTFHRVAAVIGEDRARALLDRVEPTLSQRLTVRPAD